MFSHTYEINSRCRLYELFNQIEKEFETLYTENITRKFKFLFVNIDKLICYVVTSMCITWHMLIGDICNVSVLLCFIMHFIEFFINVCVEFLKLYIYIYMFIFFNELRKTIFCNFKILILLMELKKEKKKSLRVKKIKIVCLHCLS